jgi:hypothetical protein
MHPADAAVVRRQLGRPPRGATSVSVRCPEGSPAVIETSATLEDGTPFPTRFWLTCPALAAAVQRVESEPGWAEGREGPHRNCLHREVAEILAERESAGRLGDDSLAEPSRQALEVIDGWECTWRHRCEDGRA